jgi:multicomponent Na+:H+ antiporter subunit E
MRMLRSLTLQQIADVGARAASLFGLWLILTGADPDDLAVGALAAVAATWISLRLLPPSGRRIRLLALVAMALPLAREAIWAGADVAWRALDPRLPLLPGFVTYRLTLPPGFARDAFGALASLLPGTVAAGRENGNELQVHCLDTRLPVAAQLATHEAAIANTLGRRNDV